MIGAIIGDIVGSRFEWNNIKTKEFTFFHPDCHFTDDSVMTLAVGNALLEHIGSGESLAELTVQKMQGYGRKYRKAGYGGLFRRWLKAKTPQPYGSFGNGSAMRVSAVAHVASSPEEVQKLSHEVTAVTHDHEEGLKGAEATAMAIYLARTGAALEKSANSSAGSTTPSISRWIPSDPPTLSMPPVRVRFPRRCSVSLNQRDSRTASATPSPWAAIATPPPPLPAALQLHTMEYPHTCAKMLSPTWVPPCSPASYHPSSAIKMSFCRRK